MYYDIFFAISVGKNMKLNLYFKYIPSICVKVSDALRFVFLIFH